MKRNVFEITKFVQGTKSVYFKDLVLKNNTIEVEAISLKSSTVNEVKLNFEPQQLLKLVNTVQRDMSSIENIDTEAYGRKIIDLIAAENNVQKSITIKYNKKMYAPWIMEISQGTHDDDFIVMKTLKIYFTSMEFIGLTLTIRDFCEGMINSQKQLNEAVS